MKDLLMIIAFVKVYNDSIFCVHYFNLDQGKDNLESYFLPRGWTKSRIRKAVKILRDNGIVDKVKADAPNLYKLSLLHKTQLLLID